LTEFYQKKVEMGDIRLEDVPILWKTKVKNAIKRKNTLNKDVK